MDGVRATANPSLPVAAPPSQFRPNITERASQASYISNAETEALHTHIEAAEPINQTPSIANTGMRLFTGGFRIIAGLGAAFGGVATVTCLFLFSAKIAFLCALPTLAALAGYIALKPKEELQMSFKAENQNLLEQIASDDEVAKPHLILSRAREVTSALNNARNNWGSLNPEQRNKLLQTLENVKGKLMKVQELYQELANQGKAGLAKLHPNCSLDQLNNMLRLIDDTSPDLAVKIGRKLAREGNPANN